MRSKAFSFPVTSLAGSSVSNIITQVKEHPIHPKYYGKLTLTLLVASIFEVFNSWERVRWGRRIKAQSVSQPPVFIIGFWRSGTTLLHNLMCQDPAAAYTTTLQTVFPHITLSQGWWIKGAANLFLPGLRPFDNVKMDMGFPQEEEFGLTNIQPFSLYNFFLFPADFDRIVENELFPDMFSEKQLEKWQKHYREMAGKAMLNTGGTRYISKNPCNLVRMTLLKKMYPNAKFIFIYRNPYQVVESLYRFVLAIFPGVQLQAVPDDFNREKIVQLYATMMRYYLANKSSIPASDILEIKMEEFVQDKMGMMNSIYDSLGLDTFSLAKPGMEKHLRETESYARDSYEIEPEIYELVNKYAPDIVEQLGYKKTATHEVAVHSI
jgi:hypothetical protein